MNGLIIDEPWITKILTGEKTWEMRTSSTSARGQIALIKKGSGAVVGVARVTGSLGPLGLDELRNHAGKHMVPIVEFESGRAAKWTTAWELADARPLRHNVPYCHPPGAVIWVNLSHDVEEAIFSQLKSEDMHIAVEAPQPTSASPSSMTPLPCNAPTASLEVPVAKDGTWFGPHLSRSGYYTIGEKGDEQKVANLHEAIRRLRAMQVPRWRRPNPQDNWGIVSGTHWKRISELAPGS